MNIMKIWYLKWGNGMVGIFKDSNLDQISNVSEKELDSELDYIKNLYNTDNLEICKLYSHEQLNDMRKSRCIEPKIFW